MPKIRREAPLTVTFIASGKVERWQPSRRAYAWRLAYSENGTLYPWLTKREAQASAKARGAKAVFVETRKGE